MDWLTKLFGLDSAPQTDFDTVRRMRELPGADQEWLSMEDRRAFAREFTRDTYGLGAIPMAAMVPLEQVYKAVRPQGRSGFHNPAASVGAGYTGILQGLFDLGRK